MWYDIPIPICYGILIPIWYDISIPMWYTTTIPCLYEISYHMVLHSITDITTHGMNISILKQEHFTHETRAHLQA